jgi:hypothetical protein
MAQARTLIPADRIHFVIIGANDKGGTLNKDFTFDGNGQQLTNGEADGSLPGLTLPRSVYVGAAARGAEPLFDHARYVQLLRENKKKEADQLSVAYQTEYDAFTGLGGAPLGDTLIDACFDFIRKHVKDLHIGAGGDKWNVVREQVVARIPNRLTPDAPVMIVIQPTPSWGN